MAFQEWIIFLFLEPVRRPRAFLIARAHVARNRFAESFRFRAFESNDFLGHPLFLGCVGCSHFFFLAFGGLFIGQAKERCNGLPDA